jgi:sortase A
MRAVDLRGGRAVGRGLAHIATIGLIGIGLFQIAAGAIIPAKAVAAQFLLERAFDRSIASGRRGRPWPWADMAPIARLGVPRLGVDRIILDSGSGQAMAFGPTLLPGGAALNGAGTAVIAAHRDTHFRFLQAVRIGDEIDATGLGGVVRRYRVTATEIVRWDRFAIGAGTDARELALVTCYPFAASGHGPMRYVVHAVEVAGQAL